MIILWVYLAGLTVCFLGGIVTAFYEKHKFKEDRVSASAWSSIVLYSAWWPFVMLLNLMCLPFSIIDKRRSL
jgi:hypothetical protein